MDDQPKYSHQTPAIVWFFLKNHLKGKDTEGFRLDAPEIHREFDTDDQAASGAGRSRSTSDADFEVKGVFLVYGCFRDCS
jgi:hypothetical protein